MALTSLYLHEFRSYHQLELHLDGGDAVFVGANGVGKTNLLESLHLLCTGRSQRGASRRSMINHDSAEAHVRGLFAPSPESPVVSLAMGFSRDRRVSLKRNDVTVGSLSEWFALNRVVSFGPEDIGLVQGAPAERRRYMDTLLSQQDSAYLRHLIEYRRCLQNRNKLLEQRRRDRLQFQVFEEALAEHGAYLFARRIELFADLEERFKEIYRNIALCDENGEIRFAPSVHSDYNTIEEWKNVFLDVMDQGRAGDLSLGYTSRGPHRDDFRCTINGKAARSFASQGQCRSLALALRLSSVFCLRKNSDEGMILLVDDAHTELDPNRTLQLYPLIKDQGQLLVSSHSSELPHLEGIRRFHVTEGAVESA